MSFSSDELNRYARHIVLHEIGGPGQQKLKAARVLVVGAGGLGSPAIQYLAAAGVGTLGVVDDDVVSLSNLQRQVLHNTADLGIAKVESAEKAIHAINPNVVFQGHKTRLTAGNAEEIIAGYDIVLDGSDNFDTRYLVNRVAFNTRVVLVMAAIGRWEGQLSVFKAWEEGPCYECVFPERPAPGLVPTCAEAGVLGALAGVMGAMQAVEAVKVITGAGTALIGRLMLYDSLSAETRVIRLVRNPACPVCGDSTA